MTLLKKIAFCFGHGMLLTGFVFFWLSCGLFTSEDKLELKWTELTRRSLLHLDPKPLDSIAFVDVSGAKDLIPDHSGSGTTVVTDRRKLAAFIHNLNESHAGYTYILCDVMFLGNTGGDDSLAKALAGTKKVVVAAPMSEDKQVERPPFDTRYGLVAYAAEDETFLKLRMYYNDTLQSLPLVLFADLYQPVIRKSWFLHIDDRVFFNVQTIPWRIRPYDWEVAHHFPVYPLEQMANLPASSGALPDLFHGKLIVLGDFKADLHHTVIGEIPGAVILTNAYLSLVNRDNQVTAGWIVYLFVAFTLLSWVAFYYQPVVRRRLVSMFAKYPILRYTRRLFGYAFCLYVIAIGSYLLFRVFINILVLTVYFSLLNKQFIRKIIPA